MGPQASRNKTGSLHLSNFSLSVNVFTNCSKLVFVAKKLFPACDCRKCNLNPFSNMNVRKAPGLKNVRFGKTRLLYNATQTSNSITFFVAKICREVLIHAVSYSCNLWPPDFSIRALGRVAHGGQMLHGVIIVQALARLEEPVVGQPPGPSRSVGDDQRSCSLSQASPPRLGM
jgi:hypothetical protein